MSGHQANLTGLPTVSVVIAAFAMERWNDLQEAVTSVRTQTIRVLETIVVIDQNATLLERTQCELPDIIVIPNVGSRGASGARNSGVAASHGEVVAFLDDDAFASANWLESLLRHFLDPDVVGVGGRMIPLWAGSRPRWFPQEFDWAVGASYRGMPEKAAPVRNVWGCNMAIPRRVFDRIGGFREDIGKAGHVPARKTPTFVCAPPQRSPREPGFMSRLGSLATVYRSSAPPSATFFTGVFMKDGGRRRWLPLTVQAKALLRNDYTLAVCFPRELPVASGMRYAVIYRKECEASPSRPDSLSRWPVS